MGELTDKKSKYYALYRFANETDYKVKFGKDGITDENLRNLRNTIKVQDRSNKKSKKLDTISFEALVLDAEKNIDLADPSTDVEIIIEIAEDYKNLYRAIEMLLPRQKSLFIEFIFRKRKHLI